MDSILEKFKNKFIVFEGGDQTGKTSVAKLLVDLLIKNNIDTIFTFQPGDQNYGQIAPLIRSFCKDKRWDLSKYGNLFAFLLDRAEVVDKVVRPALLNNKTVISDRATYSTVAYQLYGKGIYNEIAELHGQQIADALLLWFIDPYPDVKPDLVYYFPEKIGSRQDDDFDLFDKATKDFNIRVQTAYEKMYNENMPDSKTQWIKILPGKSAEETLENLLEL
jgi:dTMP kinase